jgi:predicted nucleic acid-binding protein
LIAVDSSALIDVLRGTPSPEALAFGRIAATGRIILGDVVLLEVLRGVSSEARAARVAAWLERFEPVAMLGPERAGRTAAAGRRLRGLGITPGFADLVIGSWCAEARVPLLTRDTGFARMAEPLGLALHRV